MPPEPKMPPQKTVSFKLQVKNDASPFNRALEEYIKRRGKKSRTPQLIADMQSSPKPPSKQDVNNALKQLEKETTDSAVTRNIRKVLRPVITVLADYSGVVDTMSNADPMPTAIIWGCMKIVIDTSKRYLNLYDDIKNQLEDITLQLNVLTEFEELFGDSKTMQELLQMTYIDVIRFWVRVDKECRRCVANRMGRALSSFSTSKLDVIIKDIEKNADRVSKLVPVVQERVQKGEREDAAEERRLAGIARDQQSAFIEQQLEEMKLRAIARKSGRQKDVRNWLRGHSTLNESNFRRQEQYLKKRSPDTCSWLFSHDEFKNWKKPDSKSPVLWVRAVPGAGKSVLTAFTQSTFQTNLSLCSLHQYYSFDEIFSSLQVYCAVAEQLANRLWTHLEDMPEDIHAFTQQTSTAFMIGDVKTFIRMSLSRLPPSYLFLDGLDEECDSGPRWEALSDALSFFIELTRDKSYQFKLWCSSQDRTDLKKLLKDCAVIEVTKDINSADIELYLSKSILKLDSLDLDEGYQNLILQDLRQKADGCFLWASLMLDSVSSAVTLSAVQYQVQEGLPKDYENYYQNKIDKIEASQKSFVSKILACIVYARRPLRLDELCESIAILDASDCDNVDKSQKLFRSMALKLCEPLVQIEDVDTAHGKISTCTLTHGSVRQFLVKHPQCLSRSEILACEITEEVMANVCLKYLWQSRYQRLLIQSKDTFEDYTGEDVMEHHLLSYAAKYWDKHLDGVTYTSEICSRVQSFITSPQFFTCLQVQSLFIGGQFQFWLESNRTWTGPHLRRVFPAWLSSNCDKKLEIKYSNFVGEWNHVLDRVTNLGGKYPGEIDRVFWASMGPKNFLQRGQSRYKNFIFQTTNEEPDLEIPSRYYDGIDPAGQNMVVLKIENLEGSSEELEFICQQWTLGTHRPKLTVSQKLNASRMNWCLYDHPVSQRALGRPIPVSLTPDLQYLRIGSQLFAKQNGEYTSINIFEKELYFEDMANSGPYIAIASRQNLSHENLLDIQPTDDLILDYGEYITQKIIQQLAKGKEQAATKASTSPTTTIEKSQSSQSSSSSSNSSVLSLVIEDAIDTGKHKYENITIEEFDDLVDASDISSDDNSAETDWSEGSTLGDSDELDDDDQWNDWANERFNIEDLNENFDGSDDQRSDDGDDLGSDIPDVPDYDDLSDELNESGNEEEMGGIGKDSDIEMILSGAPGYVLKRARLETDPEDADSSVASHYSQSLYSGSESGDSQSDENIVDNEEAHKLEILYLGNKNLGKDAPRVSIQIFDTTTQEKPPIFHFSQRVSGGIFHSPPTFHPTIPLLVWPLGDGKILFANYLTNTYFTRELCCSTYHSCHIFVKTRFSSCGEFIHFAALEGCLVESEPKMHLSLQVSTHHLSSRKTARSPPRLLFKINVPLGESSSMSVSRLPYTLTWTDRELFFVTRGEELSVMRIPLFKGADDNTAPVCYTQNPIYLPRSAESRNVYYFPPSKSKKEKDNAKGKEEVGKIIIGSHSSIPSQGLIVPRRSMVQPPIGVLVKESTDLGGWKCKSMNMETDGNGKKERINVQGGRLQGKFESFDLKEDCDIIPYLF
ncbi:putative nacht domain protein [Botrytis fragariae]|uniref:Putative nacht domain protein n=1 Tax=Botrytis fragariae TaxID=1964551 RepID=A0A8H6B509_9HELO|nr:putative nacht domain protein [Botrytis fragariae]KAF5879132.1 putative nacht domain protein [Botrytis fragariae]